MTMIRQERDKRLQETIARLDEIAKEDGAMIDSISSRAEDDLVRATLCLQGRINDWLTDAFESAHFSLQASYPGLQLSCIILGTERRPLFPGIQLPSVRGNRSSMFTPHSKNRKAKLFPSLHCPHTPPKV